MSYCMIYVNVPSEAEGEKISQAVLEKKLVACVNMVPGVRSRYWWQGKIEDASEVMLIMKTRQALFTEACAIIKEIHPYEVPEIISVNIDAGHDAYLKWVNDETKKEDRI